MSLSNREVRGPKSDVRSPKSDAKCEVLSVRASTLRESQPRLSASKGDRFGTNGQDTRRALYVYWGGLMSLLGRSHAWRSTCHDPRVFAAAFASLTLIVGLIYPRTLVHGPQPDAVAASANPTSGPARTATPRTGVYAERARARALLPPSLEMQPAAAVDQPVVRLRVTKPAFGATLKLGSTVTVAATVSGPVSAVHFCVNGRPIGMAAASPYSVKWVVSKPGSFRVTAMTFDENGAQPTTSSVLVTVPETVTVPDTVTGPPPDRGGVPAIRRVKGIG